MKYALVTGCDHGVGLALAEQLLDRGYLVTAGYVNTKETSREEIKTRRSGLVTLPLDIGDTGAVAAAAAGFPYPCLDLIINNAGILGHMENGPEDPLDYELMQRVINVNAIGTLRVTAAFLPLLLKDTDKTVVNITSEAGSIHDCERTGWFGYCMSKAANNMQGALIHNTLRRQGGRVFQIHPGHVATYMRGHLDTTAAITPDESAAGILRTVLDTPHETSDRPLYLDWQGRPLPW